MLSKLFTPSLKPLAFYNTKLLLPTAASFFSSKTSSSGGRFDSDKLGDNFQFPRHKEMFNDMYYDDPPGAGTGEKAGAFESNKSSKPFKGKDYVEEEQPFDQENLFVPGGILS